MAEAMSPDEPDIEENINIFSVILNALIEEGDAESVTEFLDEFPNLSEYLNWRFYNDDMAAPLHYAVSLNKMEICKLLIEKGADVNLQTKDELKAPLHVAVEAKVGPEIMRLLIQCGADIEMHEVMYCTPLNYMFIEQDIEKEFQFEKFKILIDAGADVNTASYCGSKPLHSSPQIFHSKECEDIHDNSAEPLCDAVTKMLIERGANVNALDTSLHTPLHYATGHGCPNVVETLLKAGGDFNAKDNSGITPLHTLARHTTPHSGDCYGDAERYLKRRITCLDLMCSNGADINSKTYMGETCLHFLLARPSMTTKTMLTAFIEHGADPNLTNTRLESPLHYLSIESDKTEKDEKIKPTNNVIKDVVDGMIKYGADLECKDINGRTALLTAFLNQNLGVFRVLLENGAALNCKDKFGRNFMHLMHTMGASDKAFINIIKENVSKFDAVDNFGTRPCEYSKLDSKMANNSDSLHEVRGTLNEDDTEDEGSSKDTVLINKLLGVLSPPSRKLDISKHIAMLKSTLGNIDEFCEAKINELGTGKVSVTQDIRIIQEQIEILVNRIANVVRQCDARFAFTPVLSGSMSEGTKIGKLDEFDYLLYMDAVTDLCCITEADDVIPGFVHIKAKQDTTEEKVKGIFRENDNALVANIFGSSLYRLIQKVLGDPSIWDSLNFYWVKGPYRNLANLRSISDLELQWAGKENNGLEISIDLAPVIHTKSWWPKNICEFSPFLRVPTKAFGSLVVVSKPSPEEETFEEGNETYLRLSYSHIEKAVFLGFPEFIRQSYILAKVLLSENVWPSLRSKEQKIPNEITSYMLKMTLFSVLEEETETRGDILNSDTVDSSLQTGIKDSRKLAARIFEYLETCIGQKHLPSYFLPSQNILRYHQRITFFDRITCSILKQILT